MIDLWKQIERYLSKHINHSVSVYAAPGPEKFRAFVVRGYGEDLIIEDADTVEDAISNAFKAIESTQVEDAGKP